MDKESRTSGSERSKNGRRGRRDLKQERYSAHHCWRRRWRSGTMTQTMQTASRSWEGPSADSHQGNGDLKGTKFYQQPEIVRKWILP